MNKIKNKLGFTPIKSGFTLVELLIVMTLISILASLVTVNLRSTQMRGRDAVRKADLRNIQTALRLYYNDFNSYPLSSPVGGGAIVGCGGNCTWGQAWVRNNTTYMSILPDDPLKNVDYVYTYVNSDDYVLMSCLEAKNDPKGIVVPIATCASGFKYEVRP